MYIHTIHGAYMFIKPLLRASGKYVHELHSESSSMGSEEIAAGKFRELDQAGEWACSSCK
jgi:hypothetical protein